jgi:hypothetical protein
MSETPVTPAKAGVQGSRRDPGAWLPAFAGMTDKEKAA